MELVETSIEGFGSWDISDITQSEDIAVLLVLESIWVNIKESVAIG